MSTIIITRLSPKTHQIKAPHRYLWGFYKVADPAFGADKKKDAFEIRVRTLEEVRDFALRGFHVRMSAGCGAPPSLIAPQRLTIRSSGDKA